MLIDQLHFLFHLGIAMFLVRLAQAKIGPGATDSALAYLFH